MSTGPLTGVRIVEVAGLGAAPFAAMILADYGADVLRVDRADRALGAPDPLPERVDPAADVLNRGRRSVALDLKHPGGRATMLRLVEQADALIEGFRPGVMERLGLGPQECGARNQALVYGRLTGWGQQGPLACTPGHDINYIAVAGALEPIGRAGQPPTPPLSVLGDFAGGGLMMALGLLAAIFEARRSGAGQVVDVAMLDGAALLLTHLHGQRAAGVWRDERGTNRIDSGAPFYDVYETADGRYVAVGAIEPRFYAVLLELLGIDAASVPDQMDRRAWPQLKQRFAAAFRTRTRAAWCGDPAAAEACVSPALAAGEVAEHPHNQARDLLVDVNGVPQPAPAPRFSRTRATIQRPPPRPGEHTREALAGWGFDDAEIATLIAGGAAVSTT